jgi:hypothetical protein
MFPTESLLIGSGDFCETNLNKVRRGLTATASHSRIEQKSAKGGPNRIPVTKGGRWGHCLVSAD